MEHRYTRNEVERMMGVTRRELDYWTRLRLILPQARWGERFYNFSDLVALETIKRLAARKVPARRIRRAVTALQTDLRAKNAPISRLGISANGKEIVVYPPAGATGPYEPLTGQFVFNFDIQYLTTKVHSMPARSAEEWFELGMMCDSDNASLNRAVEAYRNAVEAAPDWAEARINLGTSLYQLGQMEEALQQFTIAVATHPANGLAEFNLGCVYEQMGNTEEAILHLIRAIELAPSLADAHLNLALAYEKCGRIQSALEHLSLYVRYEPTGPWADFAHSRIAKYRSPKPLGPSGNLTPFRRKK